MNRFTLVMNESEMSLQGRKVLFNDMDLFFMLSGIDAGTGEESWKKWQVKPFDESFDAAKHILCEEWMKMPRKIPTIREIISEYLEKYGFDGLVNTDAECGCSNDELFLCESSCDECQPAYIHKCSECTTEDKEKCELDVDRENINAGCFRLEKKI